MAIKRIVSISVLACVLSTPAAFAADTKAVAGDGKDACRTGRAQYASGDAVRAAKTLARCVEHEPRNREAWASLANAELETGRFAQSADAFAKAHALKPGDDAFLAGYLSALEGADRTEERIPVLRAIAGRKPSDRKRAEALLAAVEASGPDKHAEEYLWALQTLGEGPGADRYHLEKLAAAYLKRGVLDKAEAEYRGLLVKSPESAENWAGLGAALATTDPHAASECYRKASFYSNQATQRSAYSAEHQRLAKAGAAPIKSVPAEDPKVAVLAAVAPPAQPTPAAAPKADPAKEKEAREAEAKAKEEKRKQDELASKQAEAEKQRIAKEEKARQEQLAKEAKAKQEAMAKAEKATRDSLVKVAESKAKEEKAKQEAMAKAEKATRDSLAKVAELKAKEEKAKQEALAKAAEQKAKDEKAVKDALAQAEKAKQDSLAKVAAQKPKPAPAVAEVKPAAKPFDLKAYQDSIYKAELEKRLAALNLSKPAATAPAASPVAAPKADPAKEKEAREAEAKAQAENERKAKEEKRKQDELARKQAEAEKERLAKAEKAKQDSLARVAEQKAKEEKARQDALAKAEKAKKDSLAKVAELKVKEEKARQEALAKAEKAKQDSLARVAEQKAKEEKARQEAIAKAEKAKQDSLARVAEQKAKEEKAAKEAHAKAEKAKQDSLARVAEQRAKEEKARQEAIAKAEKAKQDSLVRVAEAKAKAEKALKDSLARVAEQKAREEKARQEAIAKAEKAKQDSLARVAELKAKAEKALKDSLARVAEQKAKEEKARLEALAKAEKAKQDSLARVAEAKAKAEKALKDSLARVAEQKAKEEKARQEALAKAEKARQDSLARVAEQKAKEEKARQEAIAKAEKARQDSLARVAELKAKEEKARLERERLARERKDRFDRAYALYRDGRMDTAAIVFKTVLADSPIADAWYYAGRTHLSKGDHSRAFDLFGKSPAGKPDLDGLKGKALMGMGKHKEALTALEIQYAKSKDDSLLPDIVALKRKNGDAAGAIATLELLAEKRPGVIRYQEELAVWWRGKGHNAKASDRYSRVFILDPLHGEANYWLGMEASRTAEQMRAVSMLERAVVAFPTRADAWKALAKGNLALGRKDAAWETHRKACALLPGDLELAKGRLALARESHPADLAAAHENVLRIAPGDADAAMGLARIRFQQGDFAAAERHFKIACKDSKDSRAWAEYGRSLLELKRTDEAAAALQKAVDLGDKDQGLRLDLARIRMDKGDLDWAEALVKDLAKKSPADAEPQYWLGQIALKRQQTAVAEEFFRKAHQLRPDNGPYAEALARLLRDKDEWKPAAAVLAQSEAKLTPAGKMLYGDCLAHSGDHAKALEVYGALYKQKASAALLSRRMDLLVRMGQAGQAVEAAGGSPFQDAVEVKYSLAKAHLSLAESHVLKGDLDQAVDLMKSVLKSDDHKPEYHYHLGLAYALQNRPKKALDAFTDALTYRVEYPEALFRKAKSLLAIGEIKDAENAFGELSQHADPAWKARGLYGLGLVFGAQGKPEALQHHLERSIAAAPTADAMAHLSRVLLEQGKEPEAQEWARKALILDPGHEDATVAMADALSAGKKQGEAMELARQGLKVKPLSCGLLVQSAKLSYQAGKLDSTLAASNVAIKACPENPMAYFYAGIATHSSNRPKEAKQYFKAYRKYGGDEKLVPAK